MYVDAQARQAETGDGFSVWLPSQVEFATCLLSAIIRCIDLYGQSPRCGPVPQQTVFWLWDIRRDGPVCIESVRPCTSELWREDPLLILLSLYCMDVFVHSKEQFVFYWQLTFKFAEGCSSWGANRNGAYSVPTFITTASTNLKSRLRRRWSRAHFRVPKVKLRTQSDRWQGRRPPNMFGLRWNWSIIVDVAFSHEILVWVACSAGLSWSRRYYLAIIRPRNTHYARLRIYEELIWTFAEALYKYLMAA